MPLSTGDVVLTDPAGIPQGSSSPQPIQGEGTAGSPSGGLLTVQGVSGGTPIPTAGTAQIQGYGYSSFSPDPSAYATTNQTPISMDAEGRLETHSTVTSDEGSFRDDFPGSGLTTALTGTLAFTNAQNNVVGTGTSFTTQVDVGQWIKKSSDGEAQYAQVLSVSNNTLLVLAAPYSGTTASGQAAVVSNWKTVTPTGGSVAVASSVLSIASGTTSGQSGYVQRNGDYLPYTLQQYVAVSQRIANQSAFLGFADNWASPNKQCWMRFTGTTNTQVDFVTSSSAAEVQVTTVTLPNGGITSAYRTYKIDLSGLQATLSIDGVIVAQNELHLPGPYDVLAVFIGIQNTGTAASNTTVSSDYTYFSNVDRTQISSDFQGESIPTISSGIGTGGWSPLTDSDGIAQGTPTPLAIDVAGNLNTRSRVLSDEDSFRDDFQGSTLDPRWTVTTAGSGTSYSVASSLLTLSSGTVNGAEMNIRFNGDYGPMSVTARFAVSQRIANQVPYFGFCNDPAVPASKAIIMFDGNAGISGNTQIRCHVQCSATEFEEDVVTLPFGWTTAEYHDYTIEVGSDYVSMMVDGEIVAYYYDHIPSMYTVMNLELEISNQATVTNTTMTVDFVQFENFNVVAVASKSIGSPLPMRVVEEYHSLFGILTTTAMTVDQVVLTYTVPTGRTLYIHSWSISSGNTAVAASPVKVGKNTVTEPASGTTQFDGNIFFSGVIIAGTSQQQPLTAAFGAAPVRFAKGGDVVKITVTPSAATSTTWRANLNIVLRR